MQRKLDEQKILQQIEEKQEQQRLDAQRRKDEEDRIQKQKFNEDYVTVEVPEIVDLWQERDANVEFECTAAEWESGKPIFREDSGELFVYRRHVKFNVPYDKIDSDGDVKKIELHRLLPHNIMNYPDSYKAEVFRGENGEIQKYKEYFKGPSYVSGNTEDVWYEFIDLVDNQMDDRRNWQSTIMKNLKQGESEKSVLRINGGGDLLGYPESTYVEVCNESDTGQAEANESDTQYRAVKMWLKHKDKLMGSVNPQRAEDQTAPDSAERSGLKDQHFD